MGSKRSMLLNGLGEAISESMPGYRRFVDLFSGSGAVSWHVAQKYDAPVLSVDIQQYSVVLAQSVLCRTEPTSETVLEDWFSLARERIDHSGLFRAAYEIQLTLHIDPIEEVTAAARELAGQSAGTMTSAYGGYYFSPLQALWLDALRASLPEKQEHASLCLASLIWAASQCAAAPGHTAQPFKPNKTAGKFLLEAWSRDIMLCTRLSYRKISAIHSKTMGDFVKSDANVMANKLLPDDLVFLDPPYSGVQYSRFYHVLETLADNKKEPVTGNGRYPSVEARPQSQYSKISTSTEAFSSLLKSLSAAGASTIVTFPAGRASNGLSGEKVREIAETYFKIKAAKVSGRFSTLGGNTTNRDARTPSEELILTMVPLGA